MKLVTYTPNECITGQIKNCEDLVVYARLDISSLKLEEV